MSPSFSNNINSLNTVITNYFTADDDRSNILAWLSPLDPRLRHKDIRACRVENVGEWLLQTEEFRAWYSGSGGGESDDAVLFCYGDPGAGKTYISSLVIDRLCDEAGGKNATVACFYFDFAAQKEQSPANTLGALLKQLVCGLEETPEEISRAYQDQKNAIGGREPGLSDIVKMLQTTSSKKHTFICIDALDECVAGDRAKILNSLNRILQKSPGTRIFVTGRPHIRPEIGRRLSGRVITVLISPKRDDIIRYIHTRLDEDTIPEAMDSCLEADILRKIPEDVSDLFLLVSLNTDAILQETTIHCRRQRLNAMTDGLGLGDAYDATLNRIRGQGGQKSRLGMATLMWIFYAERALKSDELCHALAIEIGSPNLSTGNVPSIGTLLTCCQGLVVVDKKASTVRLIHSTLQEYLGAHPELFIAARATIAEACLSYLNSREVKALSTSTSPDLQSMPFLEYSSLYWGTHARRELSNCAKSLVLKLFDEYSNHISTQILLKTQIPYSCAVDFNNDSQFGGLHCASFFGIIEIVAGLVEADGCDINQNDYLGNTPLVWAAHNGHEGVVKILLGREDISPEKPDKYGQTPLCCAAIGGHEGVVKVLLARDDVNPNKLDKGGQMPLWFAARCGLEEVAKILLGGHDVSSNKPKNSGRTPLWWSAWKGHEGVVKILLGRDDVDPNIPDANDQTPLSQAAENGHEGVVRMLLGRDDVNPNTRDNEGRTPLWWVAWKGHEELLKILLGRDDVDPNIPDYEGRTPLWWASWSRQDEVVKILVGRDDVNPNTPDNEGRTPLWWAAWNGQEGAVKSLLGRGNVNPNKPDNEGRSPLWRAAWNGYEGVVKLLLGRDDVSPNKPDNRGQTPLWLAAWKGHEGVVKILLRRDDVNPNIPDECGQTPLSQAVRHRHEGVVEMLAGRDDVDPEKPDQFGQTLLQLATRLGHTRVMALLHPPARPRAGEVLPSLPPSDPRNLRPISAKSAAPP